MDRSQHYPLILCVIGAGVLLLLNSTHPGLRLVDFLAFCGRAIDLNSRWIDPLYPPYYPGFLAGIHPITSDALLSGRLLSFFAAILLLWRSSQNYWIEGLALLASGVWMKYGTTEGTDILAAALCIIAILRAKENPILSAVIWAGAFGTRYTSIAALPCLLLLSTSKKKLYLTVLLTTIPIWLPSLFMDNQIWDMSSNTRLNGLQGFLHNLSHSTHIIFMNPLCWMGVVGVYQNRKSQLFQALGLYFFLHILGCSLFFTNERLLLPAILILILASAHCLPIKWGIPIFVGLGIWNLSSQLEVSTEEKNLVVLSNTLSIQHSEFVSNSPWAYIKTNDGWLKPGIFIAELGQVHTLTTIQIDDWLDDNNVKTLIIHKAHPPFLNFEHLFSSVPKEPMIGQWHIYER